jgi:hypothetical protein
MSIDERLAPFVTDLGGLALPWMMTAGAVGIVYRDPRLTNGHNAAPVIRDTLLKRVPSIAENDGVVV